MRGVALLEVGEILRQVAAAEAMPRWRNLAAHDILEKDGPDDVVTVADRETERALARALTELLPGSAFVGEEAVHADPGLLSLLKGRGPTWVVDPIDGTSAFAAGAPDFAVMVALVEDQRPAAGWILAPVSGDLICAKHGAGVWQSSGGPLQRLMQPAAPDDLPAMRGVTGRRKMTPAALERFSARAQQFRSLRPAISAGVEYPRLARGDVDFALFSKSEPWDHLPGLAILSEFGFVFRRHDGSPYLPGDNTGGLLIAPDERRWNAVREILLGDA